MQHRLAPVIFTQFSNAVSSSHLLPFLDQPLAIVGVCAEQLFTVLDDDQFTIANQATATINDLTAGGGDDRLALLAANIDSFSRRVVRLEITDDPSFYRPQPFIRI